MGLRLLPRQGIALVTTSASENLGQQRSFEALVSILRDGGVFEPARAAEPPLLLAARDTLLELVNAWKDGLFERSFDPLTLRYSLLRTLRPNLKRLGSEQGRCRAEGAVTALSQTHGHFRLACERGALEFVVFLTPRLPARIQMVEVRRELPVSERDRSHARTVTQALNQGALRAAERLAPGVDRGLLDKRLARLRGRYGACELESPLWNDGAGNTAFRLRCENGPLELHFRTDATSSLLADVSASAPRSYGAPCAE